MKLERKVRLCSAAAAVLIAAIALTGCGGSKTTASSAAASSVAASTAAATSNSCGEGVTWALADGTLTISGTGRMTNFTKDAPAPWADQATRSPPLRWKAPLPAWALPPSRTALP